MVDRGRNQENATKGGVLDAARFDREENQGRMHVEQVADADWHGIKKTEQGKVAQQLSRSFFAIRRCYGPVAVEGMKYMHKFFA